MKIEVMNAKIVACNDRNPLDFLCEGESATAVILAPKAELSNSIHAMTSSMYSIRLFR